LLEVQRRIDTEEGLSMPHPQVPNPTPNEIRAVFATSAASFDMPRATTFEQLADRLCNLAERHVGPLTSIDFVTASSSNSDLALAAIVRQLAALEAEVCEAASK
jgi:hypothetical protein